MSTEKEKLIIIVGTNASGKSSLAIKLAKKFNGEIISADSRQVYKGLTIGTGKVTTEEMDGITHHLIDIVSPTKRYTAADFSRDGQEAIKDILQRGKIPIIAGGTGFYIDALLHPHTLAAVPPNEELRQILEKKGVEELFTQLKKINPKRAQTIEQKNKRRIIRAIEIADSNSHIAPKLSVPYFNRHILWIGLSWSKEELEKRIHERTLSRMQDGMILEAKYLHENGLTYKRMREFGLEYKHLADFLQHTISEEKLIEHIDIGDRQYAKRQRTWFKKNKEINWFESNTFEKIDSLVKQFIKY